MTPYQKPKYLKQREGERKVGKRGEKSKTSMPSEVAEATQLNKIQNFFNHAFQK